LKDIFAAPPLIHNILDASATIEQWLPRALQGLKDSFVDRNEDPLFCHVLQRLRKTREELPGLILPVSKNAVSFRIT
jgi:hypothetical protein